MTPPDPRPFWYCVDCRVVVLGDHLHAAQHLDAPGCWDHWMYEFEFPGGRYPYRPTGYDVHTSDQGGYYHTRSTSPAEVIERVARVTVNAALAAPRSGRCGLCRRELGRAGDPLGVDCGGDCRGCMAVHDPEEAALLLADLLEVAVVVARGLRA